MRTWNITIKEIGNPNLLHPSYTGDVDKDFIIEFFGLNKPDVEWYKIECEVDNMNIVKPQRQKML